MPFQLDTSIPLSVRAPQLRSPMESLAAMQDLRMRQESAEALAEQRQSLADERRAKMLAFERDQQRAQKLRELTEWTPETVFPIVGPEEGFKILKGVADMRVAQFDSREKVRGSMLTRIAGIKALPEPLRAEAYDAVIADYAQRGLIDPSQMAPYSPDVLAQYERELMTPEQRAKADAPVAPVSVGAGSSLVDPRTGQIVMTAPAADRQVAAGSEEAFFDRVAQDLGLKSGLQLNPRQILQARKEFEAAGRAPQQAGDEPLVAITGPDGKPVYVPRSQAIGKAPANIREQGRQVTSGDAEAIADFDTSLDDLKVVRDALVSTKDATGTAAWFGTKTPSWLTSITGVGAESKQRQATIDRVKQVIGKTLEEGVLRKEDEIKYEKILPTIWDPPSVVKAKIEGLEKAITQRRSRRLDALADANYDVSRYVQRGGQTGGGQAAPAQAPAGGTVQMTTPDGRTVNIPADKVAEAEQRGAKRVGR